MLLLCNLFHSCCHIYHEQILLTIPLYLEDIILRKMKKGEMCDLTQVDYNLCLAIHNGEVLQKKDKCMLLVYTYVVNICQDSSVCCNTCLSSVKLPNDDVLPFMKENVP